MMRVFADALDENGIPITDENGDVTRSVISVDRVVCDSYGNPTFHVTGDLVTESITEIPCSYRTATGGIKDSGDVFHSDFKMSTPMLATNLEEGTIVEITDKTHRFLAVVKKMTTYNWGTNIWIDRYGNEQSPLQSS